MVRFFPNGHFVSPQRGYAGKLHPRRSGAYDEDFFRRAALPLGGKEAVLYQIDFTAHFSVDMG